MALEITINEISKLSGFSKSTVSKALNHSHEISYKTKSKIQKIASRFNYVPNNSASSLRSKKTRIIALIVPQISSILFSGLISKIQEKAFNKGFRILIMESLYCDDVELACMNTVRDGCVDGVIIIKTLQQNNYVLNNNIGLLNIRNLPIVIKIIDESVNKTVEQNFMVTESFDMLLSKISNLTKCG